jgi:tRNA threonylcarbamoyladenosine biosynthesis protein TsaE
MKVQSRTDELRVTVESEAETERLGLALAQVMRQSAVIGLVGHLGAGKTRLARAIAEGLGVPADQISSPTFVLIQEYEGTLPVYHFDAYRLKSLAEFEDLGAGEYFESSGVCLVEWADRVRELMPPDTWWITIEAHADHSARRTLRLALPAGPRDLLLQALGSRAAPPAGPI